MIKDDEIYFLILLMGFSQMFVTEEKFLAIWSELWVIIRLAYYCLIVWRLFN